ncbi:hypothetical protein ABBQ32_013217 [Trebouxia sp. C0010 RCD-2024]
MSQTRGPSTTIPPSETSQSAQNLSPQAQYPQATMSGPQATVSQTAPTTEPGFENKLPVQGQNLNSGGFRSSSGVPSEDELAQLYTNDAEAAQVDAGRMGGLRRGGAEVDGGDLPEDMQIGFSGKGAGAFGSFATPARSSRPTSQAGIASDSQDSAPVRLQPLQTEMDVEAQGSTPAMLQLPESEELRSRHQTQGSASQGAAPVSTTPQSTPGQYMTHLPQGEAPTYTEALPESVSEAVPSPESAASGRFMTPPESPESFTPDPAPAPRVLFQAAPPPQQSESTPQQFVTPTPEQAQHGAPHFAENAPSTGEAISHQLTQPVSDSGGYAGGAESAQGVLGQSQGAPSGEGVPASEGQQQTEAGLKDREQPFQAEQATKSDVQGGGALAEGAHRYPPTPDRFNRAPQPASPEDMQGMSPGPQGFGSATPSSSQYRPPQAEFQGGPAPGANMGVADIPNYPRENPLFDEDQPQQAVTKEAEPEPVAQPVFHSNPAFDEKASGQAALGSPMIPNRSPTQSPPQHGGAYEPRTQGAELQAGGHPSTEEDPVQNYARRTTSLDIPPMFDPSSQTYPSSRPHEEPYMPGQFTNQGQASAVMPQSVNTAAEQEPAYADAPEQPELHRQLSEPRDVPHEQGSTPAVANKPQVFDNSTFEQQGQRHKEPYGEGYMKGQVAREQPSEAVTAANAAIEEEVMSNRPAQVEAETVSNAAEDGRGPMQQPLKDQGAIAPGQEAVTADSVAVDVSQVSYEPVSEVPAFGVTSSTQMGSRSDQVVYPEADMRPDTKSMLVQEGDPPMGRPVILSNEATLSPEPPSASWGSAAGVITPALQPSFVQTHGSVTGVTSQPPMGTPTEVPQSTVGVEAPVAEVPVAETEVMMDQDPPIDPSVDSAPHGREPGLPVSTRTGGVTSTPQLGPASPAATQEIVPAEVEPLEDTTSVRTSQDPQADSVEAPAPVAPRPPPMTTQEIAAYRSGEDPDFDPVERRGWWEVNLAAGGGTILPSNTRGPSRGTGRGQARLPAPTMTGPHIHAGGDPSQATHFGSIVPGGTRRQQGAAARSVGQGMEQIGAAPGVYSTPPLAGQAQPVQGGSATEGGLTPTPTPVALLGEGEAGQAPRPVQPMTTQEVAAYRPAQDPRYDPTEGRPRASALPSALPSAGNDQIDNPLFEEQQQSDISSTAFDQVETVPGLKDVTHRGEQVGTPTLAQGPTARGHTPQQPPQGRTRPPSTEGYSSRPILDGSRRAARTVNLTNIGRPAQAPAAPKPYTPVQPKEGHQLGGADVLPQDSHYVKPTPYAELGSHARSALSGAGWKTTWAMEMEDAHQSGLKYPVGQVKPKGGSGFGPKAAPDAVGEPDYAALARGDPGYPTVGQMGADVPSASTAIANLPPSVTGATSGLGGEVEVQPSYMQMAPPPVHPGAPVTDRGFTGPGGAAGGARRRLAGKLFERQHSLQDPSFDPVSQRFGKDEGYGVELPVHKPANMPSGRTPGRTSNGFGSEQGGSGRVGSQGNMAASVGGGVRPQSRAPSHFSGQEELGYAEGMGPEGARLEGEEEHVAEEPIQEEPVDRSREVNERLLMEVRRRLQAARSQLNTGGGAASEADAGSPVDSPLGGRPQVLQGRGASGTPGQYWRTLEEVEAEGSNLVGRDAPSPWVQTRGPELAPKRLFQSGRASGSMAPRMRSGMVPSGKVYQQGVDGYGAGRVHNIAGGYPNRRSKGGNVYSWGRAGVF